MEETLRFCPRTDRPAIHFQNLARGVVDSKDVIYFGSLIVTAFGATRLILERRK